MTKVAATRCAGCQTVLASRRADARWCSAACRMRAQRIGEALGLTEVELGFPPAEYRERSRRFWAGMAAIEARGVLRRLKASPAPDGGSGRARPSEGRRTVPSANKARTHARHERKEQP